MRELNRTNPAEETVKHILPAGTAGAATGSITGIPVTIRVPFSLTSTATANMVWINPEVSTVLASVSYIVTGTTDGTGVIYIGRSANGTGSASNWANGSTLTAGLHDDAPADNLIAQWLTIGPGGSGTNNSIVGQLSDGVASTMGGCVAIIRYLRIG